MSISRMSLKALLGCAVLAPSLAHAGRFGGQAERIAVEAETRGEASANVMAEQSGAKLRRRGGRDLVPVIIEPNAGVTPAALDEAFVRRLGGVVDARSRDRARVLVPASALRALTNHPQVAVVRTAIPAVELGGLGPSRSEATAATGADLFHNAGIVGTGADVAVIDLGFIGLASRIA